MKRIQYDLRCGRKLILGERTIIMGILNVTPDSFSDGGDFISIPDALAQVEKMILEGVDIIDVGGESTRPGSDEVELDDELKRVIPVIRAIREKFDIPISIDTYKSKVAEAAVLAGADIINDVWGFQRDPDIAGVAAKYNTPAIAMHNQNGTEYDDIVVDMKNFFEKTFEIANEYMLDKSNIILDPGIGFGKTPEQNIQLMGRLSELRDLELPMLLGTSRKSMIGKILDLPPKQRVEGTIATTVIGIQAGYEIVRVHDVLENKRAALVADSIYRGYKPWIKL